MVVREKNCYYAIALTDFFVFLSCAEKILLIVLVVGIIVLGIVIFIKSQAVTETKRLGNGENTNHEETSSSLYNLVHRLHSYPHYFG